MRSIPDLMARIASLLIVILALTTGCPSYAQPSDGDKLETIQYGLEAWDPLSDGVQTLIDDPETPTKRLEGIREDLVGWRAFLLNAQDVNTRRVSTIQAQIEGLGPAPNAESGESRHPEHPP